MDPLLLPLCEASALCYQGGTPWYVGAAGTCQVFRSVVNGLNCFAFQGTTNIKEWMIDLLAAQIPVFAHPEYGLIHAGFWIDTQGAVAAIAQELASLGWPSYYLTGHSKGADQAQLAHAQMKSAGHPPAASRVFEPACFASPAMTAFLADQDMGWTQTWNAAGSDLVTLVPEGPTWAHQGVCTRLQVPDSLGLRAKHVIPSQLVALGAAADVIAAAQAASP